jgi:predicted HTH transcriptional regulator
MEIKELKTQIKQGENLNVEFKLKTNHPEKIIREIVAFANTQGGRLFIGVSDNREIKGLKFIDEDEYVIVKNIESHIFPRIDYQIEKVQIESKDILIFDIPKSENRPHYVMLDETIENRKAYVRVDDKSVQASKEMREILKGERKAKNIKFNYGEKETILMKYLDEKDKITVHEFSQIANISNKLSSRTLILLVLANVLKVQAHEIKDYFYVA